MNSNEFLISKCSTKPIYIHAICCLS